MRRQLRSKFRELTQQFSVVELQQLAELLAAEAEKPRLDLRTVARLERHIRIHFAALKDAEEELTVLLSGAGKTNDEINDTLAGLHRAGPPEKRRRRRNVAEDE